MAVRILEEHLINKIAAGEVVERPASVVKELVENALDAGATELRVHLRAGGRTLIRVVDDGSGMNRTDAMMCLERHATSKIRDEADLFNVHTLGFRGEALPSIASVSRFDLVTRTHDAEEGTRVHVDGGKLLNVEPAGCAPGSEISVASLFFNVPARRKFLRSVDTELGHCLEAVTREALIRPDLDVEVTHDERPLLRCVRTGSRQGRAADLLGAHGEALLPVDFSRGRLEVTALVSPVGVHRASAAGSSWLYVNGRFVRDMVMRRAVAAAYSGIVPKDRHPMVILEVRVPPEDVDVNVHPAKTEVRFQNAWDLQNAVAEGLRAALQAHGIRRPVTTEARYRAPAEREAEQTRLGWTAPMAEAPKPATWAAKSEFVPPPAARPPRPAEPRPPGAAVPEPAAEPATAVAAVPVAPETAEPATPEPATPEPATPEPATAEPATAEPAAPEPPVPPPPPRLADPFLPVPRFADLRVIGQLGASYVLCEGAGELVVIDQHAAHERVTLYRLTRDPAAALGGGQRLLTPILVDLPAGRARLLAPRVDLLARYGLDVAPMGGGTFAIQAVPADLRGVDLAGLLADVADEVAEGGGAGAASERLELTLATRACHSSVRAGQRLSEGEMRALLTELDGVDFSVCAHGRPVAIRLTASELERRFHRA